MHETIVGATVAGSVAINGQDVYARDAKPTLVRRHVGMVFQRPNPLPTRSIFENVALGPRLLGIRGRDLDELVERSLQQAYLWDESQGPTEGPSSTSFRWAATALVHCPNPGNGTRHHLDG